MPYVHNGYPIAGLTSTPLVYSPNTSHQFSHDYKTEGLFTNIVKSYTYKIGKLLDGYRFFQM